MFGGYKYQSDDNGNPDHFVGINIDGDNAARCVGDMLSVSVECLKLRLGIFNNFVVFLGFGLRQEGKARAEEKGI